MPKHIRSSLIDSDHNEWYQFSRGFCCEFDRPMHSTLSLKTNGKEVEDGDMYTVAMQRYHYMSMSEFLDIRLEEVEKNGQPLEVATKSPNVLEEYFTAHDLVKLDGEPRLIIHE